MILALGIDFPSKLTHYAIPCKMILTYYDTTESTAGSIRLNSSKQIQHPDSHEPERVAPIAYVSTSPLQLTTTHILPSYLLRSLTVSVLPVPAGPDALEWYLLLIALVIVMIIRSVSGVTTKRPLKP